MLGELSQEQIDQILQSEEIGRLCCYSNGRVYIVPINYVYDGEYIYAHSLSGMKLHIMRTNPEVCFEVDQINNTANWQSIIVWGTFEELQGKMAAQAVQLLVQRHMTLVASGQPLHEMKSIQPSDVENSHRYIQPYRIRLTEKTGRFEK